MDYVRETIRISVPIGRVWAIVSGFGGMESWAPALKSMELEGFGLGGIRVAYLDGHVSREQLLEVDAAHHRLVYSLMDPNALGLRNIRSTMELHSVGPDMTDVVWSSASDDAPGAKTREAGAIVSGFYRECLDALKAMLEAERRPRKLL